MPRTLGALPPFHIAGAICEGVLQARAQHPLEIHRGVDNLTPVWH